MLSRVLGLVREQVFAFLFGAGLVTDAFQIAFRIPNLMRDIFAEGSMSSALVPIYTKSRKEYGEAHAWGLVNKLITVLGITILAIAALGVFFAREIISLFPLEGSPEKFELTVRLAQVMIPFLPTVMFAAIWMSLLNARSKFATPALAPALFNVISIFAAFTLCPLLEKYGIEPIYGMAAGVVLGGLGQWLMQVPALRREGFRYRFDFAWKDPELARIAGYMGLGAIAMAATQVNVLVNSFLALSQGDGPVSWLNYAFRLMQFPIGVFGVAIAQVTLTKVAAQAAASDLADIRATVARSLRIAVAITLPSAVGLAAFGHPIISVIYEHGQFTAADTRATAVALACYAVGLTAYACNKVLVPVLYSLGRANLAVLSSLLAVATNVLLCVLLVKPLGFAGLALATSIGAYVNLTTLVVWVSRGSGGLPWGNLLRGTAAVIASAAVMAVLLRVFWGYFAQDWENYRLLTQLIILGAGLSLGTGSYWFCIRTIGLSEARDIERVLLRKLKRK